MVQRFRPYYFDPATATGHPATTRANLEGDYVLYADYEALRQKHDVNARELIDAHERLLEAQAVQEEILASKSQMGQERDSLNYDALHDKAYIKELESERDEFYGTYRERQRVAFADVFVDCSRYRYFREHRSYGWVLFNTAADADAYIDQQIWGLKL
jgi:hypothetical protein